MLSPSPSRLGQSSPPPPEEGVGLGAGLIAVEDSNKDSEVVTVEVCAVLASCEEVSDGCSCEDGCSCVDISGDDSMAEDCNG